MLVPVASEAEVSATDASSEKNICIWHSAATASLPRSSYGSKCTYAPKATKQTIRPNTSCEAEPDGWKKTGKHATASFRPHSKICHK